MAAIMTGIVIGVSIAAPVGPIGILCVRRTLQDGRMAGFASGMGAATADACYGFVAALGLTAISRFLTDGAVWLNILGAAFLLYLGIRIARTSLQNGSDAAKRAKESYWKAYGSTFLLTLTNPMTIVSFAGIIAGIQLGSETAAPLWFIAGVFVGSAAWWLCLCLAVGATRSMLSSGALKIIQYGSALILAGYGIYNLLQVAVQWA